MQILWDSWQCLKNIFCSVVRQVLKLFEDHEYNYVPSLFSKILSYRFISDMTFTHSIFKPFSQAIEHFNSETLQQVQQQNDFLIVPRQCFHCDQSICVFHPKPGNESPRNDPSNSIWLRWWELWEHVSWRTVCCIYNLCMYIPWN